MKLRLTILTTLIVIGSIELKAQNQMPTNLYLYYKPVVNVASMGSYNHMSGAVYTRNQWTGLKGAPFSVGAHFFAPLKYHNYVGGSITHEQYGVHEFLSVKADYAYKVKLKKDMSLTFGASLGFDNQFANYGELDLLDPNDPLYTELSDPLYYPQASFGVYYQWENFYAGISVPNVLHNSIVNGEQNIEASLDAMPFYTMLGYSHVFNPNVTWNNNLLVKAQSNVPVQFDVNTEIYLHNIVGIGVIYRTREDFSGVLRINIKDQLSLIYSYGWTFNDLSNSAGGNNEIMLRLDLNKLKKIKVNHPTM